LWLTLSHGLLPGELDRESAGTLPIIGVIALLLALGLSGLNYGLTQLLEGFPLMRRGSWPVLGKLDSFLRRRELLRRTAVEKRRDDPSNPSSLAAWELDRHFPAAEFVLPTRLGNAIRAFEMHAFTRWGLDGVAVWPRIEMLLSAEERELHTNAKIDFNVFLNAAAGSVGMGILLLVDLVLNRPLSLEWWWLYVGPFATAYMLYRQTIGAAVRWGSEVRASVDLHRLALYERLGVRAPRDFTDERALAGEINQLLLYGTRLGDELWRKEKDAL
jgi:hypothetical protein